MPTMTTRRNSLRFVGAVLAMALLAGGVATPASASPAEIFGKRASGSAATVDHSAFDALLKAYVVASPDGINRVDYGRWKSEGRAQLDAYVAALEAVDPLTFDGPEQFAFWANLYNAKTIAVMLDAYPVESIKDISLGGGLLAMVTGGPWKAKITKVNGVDLSLDDIEHGILRPVFKDPRVHYAVNCASIGCPNLLAEAFTGAKLEAQLDAGAKAYINHRRGFSVEDEKVRASSIYDWFQADFGGSEGGVLDHARKYAEPGLAAKLEAKTAIESYAYDWTANDATSPAGRRNASESDQK